MRFGSVCSGIEAASAAWHPLGWTTVFVSEIDTFPSAVLAHHYPDVPNYGDMTKFKEWPDAAIDVLVGGTPCQSFSVAGLRCGLADPRGNLMLTYLAIADRYRPEWLVWENVPGVLSSNQGRDFGAFLGGLGELGYGFAYRVLDAQYFGVAQRRRRVFVVANSRSWTRAAAVLFERSSLRGDTAPSRETRKDTTHDLAPSLTGSGRGVERSGESRGQDPVVAMDVALPITSRVDRGGTHREAHGTMYGSREVASALTSNYGKQPDNSDTALGPNLAIAFDARQSDVIQYGDKTGPLDTDGSSIAVAFDTYNQSLDDVTQTLRDPHGTFGDALPAVAIAFDTYNQVDTGDVAHTLRVAIDGGMQSTPHMLQHMQVRRLTPRECERLQGFEDDYTLIEIRGKPAADGPRYKALGNSMAVPVMKWIGQRVALVHAIKDMELAA